MIERMLERGLFASRWLLAPLYVGLIGTLILLLASFVQELWHLFAMLPNITPDQAILGALSLIDISLAGNLLVIVIFSGYENFVSKLDIDETHKDRFEWRSQVDFATMKLKLVASIVAISGIHLLKVFMNIEKTSPESVKWMIVIHLVFVISGVLLALMDWISARAKTTRG